MSVPCCINNQMSKCPMTVLVALAALRPAIPGAVQCLVPPMSDEVHSCPKVAAMCDISESAIRARPSCSWSCRRCRPRVGSTVSIQDDFGKRVLSAELIEHIQVPHKRVRHAVICDPWRCRIPDSFTSPLYL